MRVILWRPNKTFLYSVLFLSVVWLLTKQPQWRHVDDLLVLEGFLAQSSDRLSVANLPEYTGHIANVKDVLFYLLFNLTKHYGSYPPSWQILSLPITIPALFFVGVDTERFLLVVLGACSALACSYLLSSASLLILSTTTTDSKRFASYVFIASICSPLLVFCNLELFNHARTYMMYQMPALSSLVILTLFLSYPPCRIAHERYFFGRNSLSPVIVSSLAIIAMTLGFQSIYVAFPALFIFAIRQLPGRLSRARLAGLLSSWSVHLCAFLPKTYSLSSRSSREPFFSRLWVSTLFVSLSSFFLFYYIRKIIFLSSHGSSPGIFTSSPDLAYHALFSRQELLPGFAAFLNCIFGNVLLAFSPAFPNSFALFTYSTASLACFFIFAGLTFCRSALGNRFLLLVVGVLVANVIFDFLGKAHFYPTRHNIYFYPFIWLLFLNGFVPSVYFLSSRVAAFRNATLLPFVPFLVFPSFLCISNSQMLYPPPVMDRISHISKDTRPEAAGWRMSNFMLSNSSFARIAGESRGLCTISSPAMSGDTILYYSSNEVRSDDPRSFALEPWSCIRRDALVEHSFPLSWASSPPAGHEVHPLVNNGSSSASVVLFRIE